MSNTNREETQKKVKALNKIISELRKEVSVVKKESNKIRKEIKEKIDEEKLEEVHKDIEKL